jgi:hypothetical protein
LLARFWRVLSNVVFIPLRRCAISVKQHIVTLRPDERQGLVSLIAGGVAPARKLARARVLLKADTAGRGPRLSDAAIAEALEVSPRTVARVRADFAAGGVARALARRAPNRVYTRRFDADAETKLIALACSPPPEGRARWSIPFAIRPYNWTWWRGPAPRPCAPRSK